MLVKKIILYVGYVSVAVVFAISTMLLFYSRNKNETGKAKRTIGASYMTMNNPYFEVINEEIKAVVENKGDKRFRYGCRGAGRAGRRLY